MSFNPEIHHRRSIRLKEYDYSAAGAYFVTICAFQRECLFGEIVDGEMVLNEIGTIVLDCWSKIPEYFPTVILDECIAMPNHFHGIIHISESPVGAKQGSSASPAFDPCGKQDQSQNQGEAAETFASPLPSGTLRGTLGAVIQNFKSVSTRRINKLRNNTGCPVWQRNYFERVIRNEDNLAKAREYIVNNPLKWELDKENPANAKR
jgi:putative transposase